MRTMSSLVEIESVSLNGIVVMGMMTVGITQMNYNAVSVFLPDNSVLYCNHLSSGLMANSGFIQPVLTMSRYKQILSVNLSLFSSNTNEIIIATLMWTK